jgi:hypothetical protein
MYLSSIVLFYIVIHVLSHMYLVPISLSPILLLFSIYLVLLLSKNIVLHYLLLYSNLVLDIFHIVPLVNSISIYSFSFFLFSPSFFSFFFSSPCFNKSGRQELHLHLSDPKTDALLLSYTLFYYP